MQYFIKEWPDHSASIYAEDGYHLETLPSLKDALRACRNDCLVDPLYVESPFFTTRRSYLQDVPEGLGHSLARLRKLTDVRREM